VRLKTCDRGSTFSLFMVLLAENHKILIDFILFEIILLADFITLLHVYALQKSQQQTQGLLKLK